MFKTRFLRRFRSLHHQRNASSSRVGTTESSSFASKLYHIFLSPLYVVLQCFLFGHFVVNHIGWSAATRGPSMLPTIGADGDIVLISKMHKKGKGVKVGDLVDFANPLVPGAGAIKRVGAMPGDFIVWDAPADEGMGGFEMGEGGLLRRSKGGGIDIWADGRAKRMLQIPEGHFWALGDNQPHSRDSRLYGPLPLGLIKGKVTAKFWPLEERQWFESNVKPVSYLEES